MKHPVLKWFLLIPLAILLGGCAGHKAFQKGEDFAQTGNYDAAVAYYSKAVSENPDNHEYRMKLYGARTRAAQEHLKAANRLLEEGRLQQAQEEFGQAVALDPSIEAARQGMERTRNRLRAESLVAEAEQFYQARKLTQAGNSLSQALQLVPDHPRALELQETVRREKGTVLDGMELDVASDKPITLKFKDADVKEVFNILSRLSGINFIFDSDVRPQKVTILLENATFPQALELLLNMNNLGKKVLNSKTIIVYPRNREKDKQYEDQIIQTFYLSNIDAKKAVNLLRTMLQLRKIYVHEELNALVIRDTPDVVKLAQQIIEAADRADAEVVFELELVEVGHTDQLNLGPKLSQYSAGIGFANPGTDVIVGDQLSDSNLVSGFSQLQTLYTLPSVTFEFAKTMSDSEILANPKIRVKNREKANVHVGSREPVITTTTSTTGDLTSTNVQYIEVGVRLDVEPVVQLDNTVITKIKLEVSSVANRQPIAGGGEALTITTTNAQSALTLKDGERTIIGGLIRDDSSRGKTTIPLLGRIPLIGELISNHARNNVKREILLSITPHIVRSVEIPNPDVATIWSGGEDALKAGPSFGAFAGSFIPETEKNAAPPAPALNGIPSGFKPVPLEPMEPDAPVSPEPAPPTEAVPPAAIPEFLPAPAAEPPLPGDLPPELFQEENPPVLPQSAPDASNAPVVTPPGEAFSPAVENPLATAGRVLLSGPPSASPGETITLTAKAEGVRDLYSAPLFVTYDPAILEFLQAEEGDFLRSGGQPTVFTTSADSRTGRVIVGYKQGIGGGGYSGDGNLFRLSFRAKAPGSGAVGLERINFRDPSGNLIPVTPAGTVVEVR